MTAWTVTVPMTREWEAGDSGSVHQVTKATEDPGFSILLVLCLPWSPGRSPSYQPRCPGSHQGWEGVGPAQWCAAGEEAAGSGHDWNRGSSGKAHCTFQGVAHLPQLVLGRALSQPKQNLGSVPEKAFSYPSNSLTWHIFTWQRSKAIKEIVFSISCLFFFKEKFFSHNPLVVLSPPLPPTHPFTGQN